MKNLFLLPAIILLWLSIPITLEGLQITEVYPLPEIDPEVTLYYNGYLYIADRSGPSIAKMNVNNGSYILNELSGRDKCLWLYNIEAENTIFAYTTDEGQNINYLDKININTLEVVGSSIVNGAVIHVSSIPSSDYLLVLCKEGEWSYLLSINYLNMEVLGIEILQSNPQYIAINTLGNKAYISHTGGGYVSFWNIIKEPMFIITHDFDLSVGDLPGEIEYSVLSNEIFVCCIKSGYIMVIDANDGTIIDSIQTGERSFRIDYDQVHNYLWVGRGTDDSTLNAEVKVVNLNYSPPIIQIFSFPERLLDGRLSGNCLKYVASVGNWDKNDLKYYIWPIDATTSIDNFMEYNGNILYITFDNAGCAYTTDPKNRNIIKIAP